jgi:hypothetical protein
MQLKQNTQTSVMRIAAALVFSFAICWADGAARAMIHFTAVKGYYSFSIPWDLTHPEVHVPLNLPHVRSGAAIFLGHIKNDGHNGKDIIGGDLIIRMPKTDKTFRNIWKERLCEAGTTTMPQGGPQEIYFTSMEGDNFQTWHFNLLNPQNSTLITLTYAWGHDDPVAVVTKSSNYAAPELERERGLLENLVLDPYYGIPFNKK